MSSSFPVKSKGFQILLTSIVITAFAAVFNLWPLYPPLLAIAIAMVIRTTHAVLIGLALGIFAGAYLNSVLTISVVTEEGVMSLGEFKDLVSEDINNLLIAKSIVLEFSKNPLDYVYAIWHGFSGGLDIIISVIIDPWYASMLLFTAIMGGMAGILYKSGAMTDVAHLLMRKVRGPRTAEAISALLGVTIFFDDYTNTIVVGSTARAITDRFGVSRAKLAYIVDSTAAPVAGIMFISTWIGVELSLIRSALPQASAYLVWMSSVPFRFYSILAIALVFLVALTQRNFGPMVKYEWESRKEFVEKGGAAAAAASAYDLGGVLTFVLTILTLVATAVAGLWVTGASAVEEVETVTGIAAIDYAIAVLSNSSPDVALVWASTLATLVAAVCAIVFKKMDIDSVIAAFIDGVKNFVLALAILLLALSLKTATDILGAQYFVAVGLRNVGFPAFALPILVFLVSMAISYITGTSWGTFGIMVPLAAVTAYQLEQCIGPATFASIGAAFAGAIFGDHCSPISDTTVMSSIFSHCDHIVHVITQIPYAVLAALTGLIGYVVVAPVIATGNTTLAIAAALIFIVVAIFLEYMALKILSERDAKKYGVPPKLDPETVKKFLQKQAS